MDDALQTSTSVALLPVALSCHLIPEAHSKAVCVFRGQLHAFGVASRALERGKGISCRDSG